ncbi:MAG: peptidoglycan DD-metalloendopeptidase family protein [Hyphomonadaceae bacterium]|nr:peptidoglycan DD-metalloendopeptidase family protein [Hyphomonadaceae bacterium]
MIAGSGPMVLGSWPRGLRWPALAVAAAAVGLWALGGFAGTVSPELRARLAAEAEAQAIVAEHLAFTGDVGVPEEREVQVASGETLAMALNKAGANPSEANALLNSVSNIFDGRRLRRDQILKVYFESNGAEARLTGLAFRSEPGAAITVNRTFDGQFRARQVMMPLTFEVARIAARVEKSLYDSAIAGGATEKEVRQLADIFAYDIDFQRDIHPGDALELVFERFRDDEGRTVKTENLLFVSLDARGAAKSFYRFKREGEATADWYDANGKSARKFLMKTPINGARLSSGFGLRRHPILGYSALHKGTDFAAPTGTPIMAAGDGVVVKAGYNGGYGNYVRIRHSDGYETAYAHMSRFGRGVRPGVRVSQQQVIGYVGSTGRSTGPHLHYEVLLRGQQINPMRLRVPTGRNLSATELAAFKIERDRIDALRVAHQREAELRGAPRGQAIVTAASAVPSDGAIRGGFR